MTLNTKLPIKDMGLTGTKCCRAMFNGYICTRKKGHKGRHMAGTGNRKIAAVWR